MTAQTQPITGGVRANVDGKRVTRPIYAGPKGDPGEPGRDGKDGVDGKNGRDGVDGRNGTNGAPGKDGTNGLNGKDGAPGKDGVNGVGIKGDKGDTGPSPLVSLGNVTLSQTATLALIVAGERALAASVTGLLKDDVVILTPLADVLPGYTIKSVRASANGVLTVVMTCPLLALGASYSMTFKVSALR